MKTSSNTHHIDHVFNHPSTFSHSTNEFEGAPVHFRCFYSNVDSLFNKREELEARISLAKPDIIALTEIYPKNTHMDIDPVELQLPGYNLFLPSKERRGVIIYVHEHLQAQELKPISIDFEESVWCLLETETDKILIGCIYRSPNSSEENNQRLLNQLQEVITSYSHTHVVIVGDFNLPNVNWEGKSSTRRDNFSNQFVDLLDDLFLTQLINQPTRMRDGQQSNLLDLLITNHEEIIEFWELNPPLGKSDHLVLDFRVELCPVILKPGPRYAYFRGKYDEMRNHVREKNIFEIPLDSDVDTRCTHLEAALKEVVDLYVPKILPSRRKSAWMNNESSEAVREKHRAWNRYQKNRTNANRLEYNKIRNKATSCTKQGKKNFEKKLASEVKTNPKSFWQYVQSKTKSKTSLGELKRPDGTTVEDDQDKAEVLNNFFASVFTNEDMSSIPTFPDKNFKSVLHDFEITSEMVLERLLKLDKTKSPGPDGIHNRVLKELADDLAQPLADLFNKSLRSGSVPVSWKTANVTPIFKKGDKRNPGNYRPVSLTSTIGKVMEQIIRDKIINHMSTNQLYSPHQHGFRKGKSCATQLLEVTEEWSEALDKGKPIDCIYLDYKKAFDSVPHQRLLLKLHSYGIRGNVLNWITSFLQNREQQVVVNGAISNPVKVSSGIPQGSVIGPELFLLFINDLPDTLASQKNSVKLFADDTKLFAEVTNSHDHEALQDDLLRINNWAVLWQLPFNEGKCKVVHYGKKNLHLNYKLSLDGPNIEVCHSEKDLGVTFDDQLNFSQHVDRIAAAGNKKMGIIKRTFSSLEPDGFKLLYKSIVRPALEYCSQIWHPCLKRDQEKLEKVQRRATKAVPTLKDKSYPERLARLKLPSLSYRRHRADLIQTFRIVRGEDDLEPTSFFKFREDARTRGHNYKMEKPRAETRRRQNSFSHRTVTEWNNLSEQAINSTSINSFKSNLEKAWKSKKQKFNPSQSFSCPCSH